MKKLVFLLFLFSGFINAQTIIFDAPNKWVLPIGRNSETTEKLKEPLRVELKNNQLKLYYKASNKFYYDELVTPIKRVIELNKDGRTYFLLEFDHEGLIFYYRITKDKDPNYGIVYGIEIPVIENGQVIEYDVFY
jgi:hypothetical protein